MQHHKRPFFLVFFPLFFFMCSAAAAGEYWAGWYTGLLSDQYYAHSEASAIIQTSDKGFAVVGNTNSNDKYGGVIGYITKLSADGTVLWSELFGDMDQQPTYLINLTETADGDLVAVGTCAAGGLGGSNIFTVKVSPQGSVIWQTVYGHEGLSAGDHQKVYDNVDGTLSIVAKIGEPGCHSCGCSITNIVLLNINSQSGSIISEKKLGGGYLGSDYLGYKVSDGFIVLPVVFYDGTGLYTTTIQKLDEDGNFKWSYAYYAKDASGKLLALDDYSIAELQDGYLVTSQSNHTAVYQFKIDFMGNVKWMKSIKVDSGMNIPFESCVTSDGSGLISVKNGYSTINNTIIKTNPSDGSVIWAKRVDAVNYDDGTFGSNGWLPYLTLLSSSDGFAAAGSDQGGALKIAVFNESGEIGTTSCEKIKIENVDPEVKQVSYSSGPGGDKWFCDTSDLLSAPVDLLYNSTAFKNKDLCQDSTADAGTDADRIFNFLEGSFPEYLSPAPQLSQQFDAYYYRYYNLTKSFLAIFNDELYYFYYVQTDLQSLDLGTVSSWLTYAENAGY